MRFRRHHLLLAMVLGVAAAATSVVASFAAEPTIVPAGAGSAGYPFYWSPSAAEVNAEGKVTFKNTSTTQEHGVVWTGGPETPSCPGVSINKGATHWEGKCTFTLPGTYTFHCYVHPKEMTGTVTVKNVGEPSAITEEATLVGEHGATLKGTVNPEGHETSYYFKYGRTTSYENTPTTAQKLAAGSTPDVVTAPVTGLAPGTTYHFQLVAENSSGVAHGPDQTFTTSSPPGPPTATTGGATTVGETEATLNGNVNPDGEATKYFFNYGTSIGYGQKTSLLPAGEDHIGHAVSATLRGLAPGTTYHFQLVAENKSATVLGADGEFKTSSPPTPPPPTTTTTLTTPAPTTPLPKSEEVSTSISSLVDGSVKLTTPRHGSFVRGSVEVAQHGAGGRLEVDLLAKAASLAKARRPGSRPASVGRLVRQSVSAGKVSFSVALSARGKRALTRHRRLPLTVKITFTPTQGKAATVTRSVTLRA